MTVSFHKYGEYFPGTGELRDIGVAGGKYYAVNFPLRDGIDDKSYKSIFEPTIGWVMEYYKPSAVVLQCGGDSLSGDRLGAFNLSMKGHANCVNFVKSFNLPTLILGGGGYTMRNVARTWAYETGQLVGAEMGAELPFTDYYEYYSPDFELDVRPSNMDNANSPEYLEKIKIQVLENLKRTTQSAPSVQMQDVPREPLGMDETLDEEEGRLDDEEADQEQSKDRRHTQRLWDRRTERDDELSESDDEELAEELGVRKQAGRPKRRGIMDYQNPHAPADTSGDNTPMGDDARSLNGDGEGDIGEVEDIDEAMQMDGAADDERELDGAGLEADVEDGMEADEEDEDGPELEDPTTTTKLEDDEEGDAEGMDVDAKDEMDQETATVPSLPPAAKSASASARASAAPPEKGTPLPPSTLAATTIPTPPPAIPSPGISIAQGEDPSGGVEAAPPPPPKPSAAAEDVQMAESVAEAKEAGERECAVEDAEGEAATEMMGGGHNVGGGAAV